MGEQAAQDLAERIEVVLERLEAIPDEEARTTALDAVEALSRLYGEGLARIVEEARDAGGASLVAAFARDSLVSHLLLLHGLHPDRVEKRVRRALEELRPRLRSHGGSVELVAVDGDVVRLRLTGGCRSSAESLRAAIEDAVLRAAPELAFIEEEPPPEEAPVLVPLAGPRRKSLIGAAQPHPWRSTNGNGASERTDHAVSGERFEKLEKCELCARPLYEEHRHLLDIDAHRILCACQACTVLFDRSGAGGRHYRLIPDRCRFVTDFQLPDELWARLAIPVDLVFAFRSSASDRMVAFYPGPAGATESLLELGVWDELVASNPVLRELEADVEALLVNRARDAHEHWLVPVDECYRLAGVIRTHWRGFGGGQEVWKEMNAFFGVLRERSHSVDRAGVAAPAATSNGPHLRS